MSYSEAKQKHEQAQVPDRIDLLCGAFECPMEWTVDKGSKLCTHHAWAESHEWPKITAWLKSKVVMGTLPTFKSVSSVGGYLPPRPQEKTAYTPDEKAAAIQKLQAMPKPDAKAWAYKLKAREEKGDHLSLVQKKAWREALRVT
jgi:hypothetical protein